MAKKEPHYNLVENKFNHIIIQSAKLIIRATLQYRVENLFIEPHCNIEWKINLLSHIAL